MLQTHRSFENKKWGTKNKEKERMNKYCNLGDFLMGKYRNIARKGSVWTKKKEFSGTKNDMSVNS